MQREKQKIEIAIVHWLGRNDYKKFTDTIEHEYISEDEGQRSFCFLQLSLEPLIVNVIHGKKGGRCLKEKKVEKRSQNF